MTGKGSDIGSARIPGSDHPDAVVDMYQVGGSRYEVLYSTSDDSIAVYVDGQKAEQTADDTFVCQSGDLRRTITRRLAYGYYELIIDAGDGAQESGRPIGTQVGEKNRRTMFGYGMALIMVAILFREMQDGKAGVPELLLTLTAAALIGYARRASRAS